MSYIYYTLYVLQQCHWDEHCLHNDTAAHVLFGATSHGHLPTRRTHRTPRAKRMQGQASKTHVVHITHCIHCSSTTGTSTACIMIEQLMYQLFGATSHDHRPTRHAHRTPRAKRMQGQALKTHVVHITQCTYCSSATGTSTACIMIQRLMYQLFGATSHDHLPTRHAHRTPI